MKTTAMRQRPVCLVDDGERMRQSLQDLLLSAGHSELGILDAASAESADAKQPTSAKK